MTTASYDAPTEELPIWGVSAFGPPPAAEAEPFDALAAAIREHERATSSRSVPKRPGDHSLYRRLRGLSEPS
jgi:hypothetical protein